MSKLFPIYGGVLVQIIDFDELRLFNSFVPGEALYSGHRKFGLKI